MRELFHNYMIYKGLCKSAPLGGTTLPLNKLSDEGKREIIFKLKKLNTQSPKQRRLYELP